MSISQLEEHPDGETFTREEYYRVNGLGPVPSKCRECGQPLTSVQVKRGGKFCSSRCGGMFNARIPAKPTAVPITELPTSQPEGRDHPAPTVMPGETAASPLDPLDMALGSTSDARTAAIAAAVVALLPSHRLILWIGPVLNHETGIGVRIEVGE